MDSDKLNEAAKHFAAWETINSSDPNNNYYCKWGFIKGANWLMQQPLAERLTEVEKAKARAAYKRAEEDNNDNADDMSYAAGLVVKTVLKEIFGKELFNEK